jgi:nucleoside-diphosphate-sugar epimerase
LKNIWIIGCGDIGRRVFKRVETLYQNHEHRTTALVRSEESKQLCQQLGINTLLYDLDEPTALDKTQFKDAEIFYFAPPPKAGDTDTRLSHFLKELNEAPAKVVLISTTGVYGDCKGDWIDESKPVNPQTGRAIRRVAAEAILTEWASLNQKPFIILRVPGIYSRDRLPLARLKKKLPIVQATEAAFTNRIHADDLANICIEAMNSPFTKEVFNTTDGSPGTMVDYFNQIADFAGLERPQQISLNEAQQSLSAGMLSYADESRRIGNAKLLNILDIKLQYPTLESTLK